MEGLGVVVVQSSRGGEEVVERRLREKVERDKQSSREAKLKGRSEA